MICRDLVIINIATRYAELPQVKSIVQKNTSQLLDNNVV